MTADLPSLGAFLFDHYLARKARNPRFSLRSFAAYLRLSPSHLSLVLRGKRALSEQSQIEVASRLRLEGAQRRVFDLVARYQRGTAHPVLLQDLREEWQALQRNCGETIHTLDSQARRVLLERWECMALLEALSLPPGCFASVALATRFGWDPLYAELLLERLCGVGLVVSVDGRGWKRTSKLFQTGDRPDAAIRRHHKQYLDLAAAALEQQNQSERHITGCVFSCDARLLPIAFEKINSFRRELMNFLESSESRDSVYRFSAQLFRLDAPACAEGSRQWSEQVTARQEG